MLPFRFSYKYNLKREDRYGKMKKIYPIYHLGM